MHAVTPGQRPRGGGTRTGCRGGVFVAAEDGSGSAHAGREVLAVPRIIRPATAATRFSRAHPDAFH